MLNQQRKSEISFSQDFACPWTHNPKLSHIMYVYWFNVSWWMIFHKGIPHWDGSILTMSLQFVLQWCYAYHRIFICSTFCRWQHILCNSEIMAEIFEVLNKILKPPYSGFNETDRVLCHHASKDKLTIQYLKYNDWVYWEHFTYWLLVILLYISEAYEDNTWLNIHQWAAGKHIIKIQYTK